MRALGFVFCLLFACHRPPPKLGSLAALGDSLTAGYQSGSLMERFQAFSVPNIIAGQAGIKDFRQPLIPSPGLPAPLEITSRHPLVLSRPPEPGALLEPRSPGPYDNLSIPGATLESILDPFGPTGRGPNPFFDIVLGGRGNALDQAKARKPDLLIVWLGNNEILQAVIAGWEKPEDTVTPPDRFAQLLDMALKTIADSGIRLAIANIIDISEIPYVTHLPVYFSDPQNGGRHEDTQGNPIPYLGNSGPLDHGWHITFSSLGALAQGRGVAKVHGGSGVPLDDGDIISPAEKRSIQATVAEYNLIIARAAKKHGAALVDVHDLYQRAARKGVVIHGRRYSFLYPDGGLVSSDGIHPTSLGYAIIANAFIKKINDFFGFRIASFPLHILIFK